MVEAGAKSLDEIHTNFDKRCAIIYSTKLDMAHKNTREADFEADRVARTAGSGSSSGCAGTSAPGGRDVGSPRGSSGASKIGTSGAGGSRGGAGDVRSDGCTGLVRVAVVEHVRVVLQ